jgi:hypothetical protein
VVGVVVVGVAVVGVAVVGGCVGGGMSPNTANAMLSIPFLTSQSTCPCVGDMMVLLVTLSLLGICSHVIVVSSQ